MYIKPKMLFFGSPACERCIKYQALLNKEMQLHENNFTYINGDDFENEEVQKFCDSHNVDEYPHVKIYIMNHCIHEEVGDLNVKEIVRQMRIEVKAEHASKYAASQSNKSQ